MKRRHESSVAKELRILRFRVLNKSGLWSEDQITKMKSMIEDILRVSPSLA